MAEKLNLEEKEENKPEQISQDKEKKLPKKLTISVDNSVDEVVEYNSKGVRLLFDEAPGRFLNLPVEVIKQLEPGNAQAYAIALASTKVLLEEQEFPPTSNLSITPNFASPGDQMKLEGLNPMFHYCFFRADQVEGMKRYGYEMARDKEILSFNRDKTGAIIVGTSGNPEMYLMKIPKPMFDRIMEKNDQKSIEQDVGVMESAKEEMLKSGGKGIRELPKDQQPLNIILGGNSEE